MLNKQVMIDIFTKLLTQSKKSYDEFNGADGKIGDGDLGITILNGLEEINNNIEKFTDDLSTNFMICSQVFVKKSGSSFGTLIAFSFMNISKNLKGKNRPINNQNDRAYILAALEVVDYVVIFEDISPYKLIEQIKPDVLVKGGDYNNKDVVGQDIVEELRLVKFVEEKSSTKIIKKIQQGN